MQSPEQTSAQTAQMAGGEQKGNQCDGSENPPPRRNCVKVGRCPGQLELAQDENHQKWESEKIAQVEKLIKPACHGPILAIQKRPGDASHGGDGQQEPEADGDESIGVIAEHLDRAED